MYGIAQTAAPATEPILIATARLHVNLAADNTDHDTVLTEMIVRARQYVENYTNRQLVTATYTMTVDRLPSGYEKLYLPKSPLASVTSIAYLDSNNASQTLSSSLYRVVANHDPGFITLAYQQTFPSVVAMSDAVTIVFVAGYGAYTAVPAAIKQAMLILIGHWFINRGDDPERGWKTVQWGVHALLDQYRVADDFLCYGKEVAYAGR